ncbi:MAG: MBL fold metallo-hydrolase [Anaerolineae bacterium]
MLLQTLRVGPLAVNCYIVGDESSREVVVIDPGGDVSKIVEMLRQMRARVTAIILTHAHFDHIMGIQGVKDNTGAPLLIGVDEAPILSSAEEQGKFFGLTIPNPPAPDRLVQDGEIVSTGSVQLQVITTPGHTPGGICLWSEKDKALFSGDTLMRGGIGRTDFPGGSMTDELRSIRTKLLTLPLDTRVYPGHGPVTTIAEEKGFNPFLQNYV